MTNLADIERNDPNFERDLADSDLAVMKIADFLRSKGYPVMVPPVRVRESIEEMSEYSDDGDLFLLQRIEVKRRGIAFNTKEEFERQYKTVIVDVCHAWDKAVPKPVAYYILNKAGTCALVVRRNTSEHWRKVTKMDRVKRRQRSFYECPVELCDFVRITK